MKQWSKRLLALLCVVCCLLSCGCGAAKDEDVVVDTADMTDLQKAVVVTAESFYLRGNRAQYDMSELNKVSMGDIGRRLVAVKAPEDYTVQNRGYTDCSGFVYDVYLNALGFKIIAGEAWTKTYADSAPNRVLKVFPKPDSWSEEELKAKEKEFRDTLQAGDIIVYRYAGNTSGHTLLYVGNGMVIHSSGSSYSYNEQKENFEEDGTYRYSSIDFLFDDPTSRSYLFSKHVYAILRPLDAFTGEIPAQTQARMNTMRGIVAEKLSSHPVGKTANVGENITFTFHIENKSNVKRTVTVTDFVPENAVLVSGPAAVEGDMLAWTVSIPPEGEESVSYTVKVTGEAGSLVKGDAEVDGVIVECPAIVVGNTLTQDQQKEILAQAAVTTELTGLARVNAIYTAAVGKAAFADVTEETMKETLFEQWGMDWALNREGALFYMVAPHLYGGRSVAEQDPGSDDAKQRVRMIGTEQLVIGDVIYADDAYYLYTGEAFLDMATSESKDLTFADTLIACDCFAVLRPSLA